MNYAVILAGGSSKRFDGNKIFAHMWGIPVLEHVLILCEATKKIDAVYIAYGKDDKKRVEELCKKRLTKPWKLVLGGSSRFESSSNVIKALNKTEFVTKKDRFVMMNGANPLTSSDEIERCLSACTKGVVGVGVGRPVRASLKRIHEKIAPGTYLISDEIERINAMEMETPQVVNAHLYTEIVELIHVLDKPLEFFTDELMVMSCSKKKTAVVLANEYNRKITTKSDLDMMNGLISAVGIGEDSHSLIKSKKPLLLGGVKIDSELAFEADSDGDVVLHAIANALSSALGGGSLGTFASAMCEDGVTDSKVYVKSQLKKSKHAFLRVAHLSLSIEANYPKIDPLVPAMRESLAALLEMPPDRIGITATTGKSHSAYGKGKALKCIASLLLRHA